MLLDIKSLDKDAIVDATRTGAMSRFMNHCCEPNAYARIVSSGFRASDATIAEANQMYAAADFERASLELDKHIVIIAARDIQVRIRLRTADSCTDLLF